MITRAELLAFGLTPDAVKHRIVTHRLHPVHQGVYAVGRRSLSRRGEWMAAVRACGPAAALSHDSAAALWGIRRDRTGPIHVTVSSGSHRARPGIKVHRQPLDRATRVGLQNIPVTSPARTLVDMSAGLGLRDMEAAINEADKLDLIDPEELRADLESLRGRRGVRRLREALDRRSYVLTDSELERRFLRLLRQAGLPEPETGRLVNSFKVDFFWPDLGLVVETDGLRYHRTPAQQARDRLRDQVHTAAGLTPLRFTHAQVRYEPGRVTTTLRTVVARLVRQGTPNAPLSGGGPAGSPSSRGSRRRDGPRRR